MRDSDVFKREINSSTEARCSFMASPDMHVFSATTEGPFGRGCLHVGGSWERWAGMDYDSLDVHIGR